ncbi:MAG: undecaprenyl-diphosphate phosphatase [Armatimonadota bacterium]
MNDLTPLIALIKGLVQGLTEFLPVSSSAHLVFADHFLHLHQSADDTVLFDVVLHLGTLVAVLVYFWRDVLLLLKGCGDLLMRRGTAWRENAYSRLAVILLIGTIPAGVAGLKFKHYFEAAFQSVPGTACFLLVTAVMLFLITRKKTEEGRPLEDVGWKDALLIGVFQAVAIFPGISRSGATISGGLLRGLDRDAAPRFSFLLSIPIILGGGLKAVKDAMETGTSMPTSVLVIGFLAAAISGYLAVVLLLGMVKRGRLDRFAYYCAIAGVLLLGYWFLLVPRIDAKAITVAVGTDTLDEQQGVIGPFTMGKTWTLYLPVRSGMSPIRDIRILTKDGQLQIMRPVTLPATGNGRINVEIAPLQPQGSLGTVPPDGTPYHIWVILRNKWGIQNDVPLELFVMPLARQDVMSARPIPPRAG